MGIFIKGYGDYRIILTFGIVIILFNYGKAKYNFILSFLISVVLSYLVFFLSFGIYLGIGFIMQVLSIEEPIGNFLGKRAFDIFTLIPIAIVITFAYVL